MIKRFLHSSPSSPIGQDPIAALLPSQPSIDACAFDSHADASRPAARRTARRLDGPLRMQQQLLTYYECLKLHRCGGRAEHTGLPL